MSIPGARPAKPERNRDQDVGPGMGRQRERECQAHVWEGWALALCGPFRGSMDWGNTGPAFLPPVQGL